VLINEKYIGNNVWNRGSFKLKKKRVRNSPEMWIRADGVFKSIVDKSLFEADALLTLDLQHFRSAKAFFVRSIKHDIVLQSHGMIPAGSITYGLASAEWRPCVDAPFAPA
jgi:hypothetical protein